MKKGFDFEMNKIRGIVTKKGLYTVKSFCEIINELIEFFQWNMVSMMPFVSNAAFICWFEMNCLGNQLQILTKTMNIITILQPSKFNVFLHGYFLQCNYYTVI